MNNPIGRPLWALIDAAFFIIFLLLVCGSGLAQAELNARLNAGKVTLGDTVQLLIEAGERLPGSPDTEPLNQDFEVLGVARGNRANIINGKMESHSTWSITLVPKHSGQLTIPSLEVNGERTPTLALLVSEVPVIDGASGNPIFIETEVDRSDPYIQSMVLYTQRLFYEIKLMSGRLSAPQPDDALVRRLGKDREQYIERDGHHYRVLQRQYAIFPQRSGELMLPAPVLNARIPDTGGKRNSLLEDMLTRDPFINGGRLGDVYTATRPVRVRGEPTTLQVRPRPAQARTGQWLPAQRLVLSESWKPERTELRVGDPLTRSISLQVRGLTGEQLPELDPGYVEGFKVYPDRAQTETSDQDQGIEGEKRLNVAFVPVRSGSYTLPAVRLHWWDTGSDRERVAELPERSVEVLPALAGQGMPGQTSAPPEPKAQSEPSPMPDQVAAKQTLPQTTARTETGTLSDAGIWPWISLLFASLWLITLVIWWRSRPGSPEPHQQQSRPSGQAAAAGAARSRFQAACCANDARQARRELLDWAAAHWPDAPPAGLDELARRLDDLRLAQDLRELDRILYRGDTQSWDGKELAQRLGKLPKQKPPTGGRSPLPDLYA